MNQLNLDSQRLKETATKTDQPSPAAPPLQPSRLRRWAARRTRQLLWVMTILAVALLLTTSGVLIWRWAGLIGLPDIGEPFDVAALRAFQVPPEQDAYVLIRQAEKKLTELPPLPVAVRKAQLYGAVAWSKLDAKIRDWATENREVLELFRRGAERPDALVHSPEEWGGAIHYTNIGPFVRLALLEGARLVEQGDMAGAWGWYRSVVLMRSHLMRRGSVFQRFVADMVSAQVNSRVDAWAADQRTGAPVLRQALTDLLPHEPKPEWDVFSLKVDYMDMMGEFNRPNGWVQMGTDPDLDYRIGGEKLPPNLTRQLYAARRFVNNEPERSLRVLRLVFANWLAHAGTPPGKTGRPMVVAKFFKDGSNVSVPFYAENPVPPQGNKSLSPDKLAEWLQSTIDAKLLLASRRTWPGIRVSEKRHYSDMVIFVANELYRREHGAPPPSERALVGPYLDHLPDNGSGELDDGSARRVIERVDAVSLDAP
jgi:hypothetical protein